MALDRFGNRVVRFSGGQDGPRPNLPTLEEKLREMARGPDRRRIEAYRRWLIYTEQFEPLVNTRIDTLQDSPSVRKSLKRHVSLALNLGLDITRDISVVWKAGSTRRLKSTENDAFHDLVTRSRFLSHAPFWNQLAFFLGPVIVAPVARDGQPSWDVMLPHEYDVIPDPDNPLGEPFAAVWDRRPFRHHIGVLESRDVVDFVTLDKEAWRYWKVSGGSAKQVAPAVPHGQDRFPAAVLRFTPPMAGDWWGLDTNRRLEHATVDVAYLLSALSYVRKAQRGKQVVATGDLEAFPKGQDMGAVETAIVADTGGAPNVNIEVLDLDTGPENVIQHAAFIMHSVARSYGGQTSFQGVAGVPGATAFGKIEFSHDAQTEIRNAQLPNARDFEQDLWPRTVEMMVRFGDLSLTAALPDPETVESDLRIEYTKLARTYATPKEEREDLDWRMSRGLEHHGTIMQREHSEMTEDEALEQVKSNLEAQFPILEIQTRLNMTLAPPDPMEPENEPGVKTPAQLNGAQGPKVRDADSDTDDE